MAACFVACCLYIKEISDVSIRGALGSLVSFCVLFFFQLYSFHKNISAVLEPVSEQRAECTSSKITMTDP